MATKQFIGNVRGQKGDQGVSITSVKQTTTSDIDGGINEITVTLSDGRKEAFQVANGNTGKKGDQGVSVKTVAQTTTSNADGGSNVMTVTLSDGTQAKFTVKNGNKGDKGDKGDTGDLSEECADARTSATGKSYDDLKARLDVEYNFLDTKANCIEGETSGDTITDSANAPLAYMKNSGYTKQDGTPTPDVPIEIKGLGDSGTIEVKTCGKNLLKNTLTSQTVNGITFKVNEDGSVSTSGTATADIKLNFLNIENVFENGKTYHVSGITHMSINGTWFDGLDHTFTKTENMAIELFYRCMTGNTMRASKYYPQVELGDITTPYQPHQESTALIPISSPLYDGDYIDVYADGTGVEYREKGSIIVDERYTLAKDSSWNNANAFYSGSLITDIESVSGYGTIAKIKCSHLPVTTPNNIANTSGINGVGVGNGKVLFISINGITTTTELKEFLTNNPIHIVYKLATPTSTPLTKEQVAEFMKLRTYKTTTHINADGEKVVRYVVDTKTYIDNKFAELQALMNV